METPRQLDALAEGRLDAALIQPRPSYAAGVAARVIHREALWVALAADHPLARSHTLQAADLGNEAFIVLQVAESCGFGSHLERLAAAGGFPIKIVHDVGDFVTALSMAAGGYGVAIAPESMRGLGVSDVVFRPLADFAEKVELAVAFRTAEPSASVRAFIDAAVALGRRRELTPPVVSVRRQRSIEQAPEASPMALRRAVVSGVARQREPVVDARIDLDLAS
jgi:DNA-binding transcriptional LysR family regulator